MIPKRTHDHPDIHYASSHIILRVYLAGHWVNFADACWDVTDRRSLLKSWMLAPEWRLLLILQQMWQKLLPGAGQAVWERLYLHLHWFCTKNPVKFHFLSPKIFTLASQKWQKMKQAYKLALLRPKTLSQIGCCQNAEWCCTPDLWAEAVSSQNSKLVLIGNPVIVPSMSTSKAFDNFILAAKNSEELSS